MRRAAILLATALAACAESGSPGSDPLVPPPATEGPCVGLACGEGCGRGFCNGHGECVDRFPNTCPVVQSGLDRAPGAGQAFVVNAIAIAGQDRGFDLDGECRDNHCADNVLWQVGELGNDSIREALIGEGRSLLLEIARDGDSELATLRFYRGFEAAEEGAFDIDSASLAGTPPRPSAHLSVRIREGLMRSVSSGSISGDAAFALERAIVSARAPADGRELSEGMLGGVVRAGELSTRPNPYCASPSPRCTPGANTMLDLLLSLSFYPDVDLDGDGLEDLVDQDGDGAFDYCLDGTTKDRVDPVIPDDLRSCALSPRMADGYSVAISFTAVQATIRGVR